MNAREELDKVKEHLAITTDKRLSEVLEVNKRNIESWVKRNKIPDKWRMKIQQLYQNEAKHETKKETNVSLSVSLLQAGAGEGIYNFEEDHKLLSLEPSMFPYLSGKKLTALQIVGDSMEPLLRQGDYILITQQNKLRQTEDGIYAIRVEGMLKVKSLQFKLDGTIKIISDNAKYEAEIYDPSESQIDFHILGKHILTISR